MNKVWRARGWFWSQNPRKKWRARGVLAKGSTWIGHKVIVISPSRANRPAIICGVCVIAGSGSTGPLRFRLRFGFRSAFRLRPRVSKRTYWPEDTGTPAPLRFRSSAVVIEARFGVASASRWQMILTSMTVPFSPVSSNYLKEKNQL